MILGYLYYEWIRSLVIELIGYLTINNNMSMTDGQMDMTVIIFIKNRPFIHLKIGELLVSNAIQ